MDVPRVKETASPRRAVKESFMAEFDLIVIGSGPGGYVAAIIARSRAVAKQLNSGVGYLMKKNKIEVIEGSAKLEKGTSAPKVVIAL